MSLLGSYLIIESDGRLGGRGAILKYKLSIFSSTKVEKISRYDSGTYQTKVTATDAELIATIETMKNFNCS